uniref:Uncharacterized protein n=1 Tax=Eutreptiella gymnastica TaxID=73025 RepID=A0A7S4CNZ6_9EUGL
MRYVFDNQIIRLLTLASYVFSFLLSPVLVSHNIMFGIISVLSSLASFHLVPYTTLVGSYIRLEKEVEMNGEPCQQADFILIHSLKNRMADATGDFSTERGHIKLW